MMHHAMVAIAGAAAHFMTGWVLNSDMLLGKIWKSEKDKKNCLNKDMRMNLAAQAAASLALSIAVCVAIAIFEKSQMPNLAQSALEKLASLFFGQNHSTKNMMNSIHIVMFIWAGFMLPNSAEEVIWCGHNWKHWAFEMLSQLIGLVSIAVTVTYLS